nr:BspA family leucine-rich repeat surface protein [uncultured Allomuricauda sp.]
MRIKLNQWLVTAFLCIVTTLTAQDWEPLGPDDYNQPSFEAAEFTSIILDNMGRPCIAFSDYRNSKKATVRRFEGTSWEMVGSPGFSDGQADYTSIAMNSSGIFYVVYSDVANSGKATVKRFNGTTWESVGEGISSGLASDTTIAIDHNGVPYVAYVDEDNFGKATVSRFNGASWEVVGEAGFSGSRSTYLNIDIDTNGIPYVAYRDTATDWKASVQRFNGTSWEAVGSLGLSDAEVNYVSMALDNSNVPYVIYRDWANDSKSTVKRFNGTIWELVGSAGFSNNIANYTQIDIDDSGVPYVIYSDVESSNGLSGKATIQRFNGLTWETVGGSFFSSISEIVSYTGIVLDNSGMPYVTYVNGDGASAKKANVYHLDNTSWVRVGTAGLSEGFTGSSAMTIDTNNVPYVVYRDGENDNKATVRRYTGGSWEIVGNAGFSVNEPGSSFITIDNLGLPWIAYISLGNPSLEVEHFNGVEWEAVGGLFDNGVNYPSMTMDNSGTPYIAYGEPGLSGKIIVRRFNGTAWEYIGDTGFSPDSADHISIALDNSNVPYVAYGDAANSGKIVVQRYNGTDWEYVGDAGFSSGTAYGISIKLDKFDTPYVVYSNQEGSLDGEATVQRFNGVNWEKLGSLGVSSFLAYPVLNFDNPGVPYVFYRDSGNGNLVYRFNETNWEVVGDNQVTASRGARPMDMVVDDDKNITVVYIDGISGGPVFAKMLAVDNGATTNTAFITTWKTDNPGVSEDNQITIPTHLGEVYDYAVDWGDGTSDTNVTGDITHTYTTPGTYEVAISGNFPRIYFNFSGDKEKIISVDQWGEISWKSMEWAFAGCANLDVLAMDVPNFTQLNSLATMFVDCTGLVGNDTFNDWDLSTVTTIDSMFRGATNFNSNIGDWNTTNITSMISVFYEANSFNQDIEKWDTSKVESMRSMFLAARMFNSDIGNWNVSNVMDMTQVFTAAENFNQDIGNWDVSNAITMDAMFAGATLFNQNIENWNVSKVINMNSMFAESTFNHDISSWDVSEVRNIGGMFTRNNVFNQDIGNWDVSNVEYMSSVFSDAISFDQNLGNWNVSKVKDMTGMFWGCRLSLENYDSLLIGWSSLASLQSGVYFAGDTNLYCESEIARQFIIDTYGWTINDGGKMPLCNEDDDADGVLDHLDSCLYTLPSVPVNAQGCEIIDSSEILVYTETPTCVGESNGAISISTSLIGYLFDIEITGNNFTQEYTAVTLSEPLKIGGLATGIYSIRISIPDALHVQEFGASINEINAITGKRGPVDSKNGTVHYSVSGSESYVVDLNGQLQEFNFGSAAENVISLSGLESSNSIIISGINECQGKVSDTFSMSDEIFLYPILTSGKVYVDGIYDKVQVKVFDITGKLVIDVQLKNGDTNFIDFQGFGTGVYPVTMTTGTSTKSFKIIKK